MSAHAPEHSADDGLGHPSTAPMATLRRRKDIGYREEDDPNLGQQLASAQEHLGQSEQGHAQVPHEGDEDVDLGWDEEATYAPGPLIGDLSNEELWTLIRRFDKMMFHVQAVNEGETHEEDLDLNIIPEQHFNPDKLRAQFERLYMTVGIGIFGLRKHLVRLRSWRERNRTAAFCAVYTIAWAFDILLPTLIGFLIVLILFAPLRDVCFPPAPPALFNDEGGGMQTPLAGVLASYDSMTGAPENHPGEAVEKEAHSVVNGIASLAAGVSASRDPAEIATIYDKAGGNLPAIEPDKTKKPVLDVLVQQAQPGMHSLSKLLDAYERIGNALSPTPPFPSARPRLLLSAYLLQLLLFSYYASSYMLLKGLGLVGGLLLFGEPLLQRGKLLLAEYPRVARALKLRNSILNGVPTNAQLTLTLLRMAERNRTPLPPAPKTHKAPPVEGHSAAGQQVDALDLDGVTRSDIDAAIEPDEKLQEEEARKPENKGGTVKERLIKAAKSVGKKGIGGTLRADRVRAATGSKTAKDRLGVIKKNPTDHTGPSQFLARLDGHQGYLCVFNSAVNPSLAWRSGAKDGDIALTIPISRISEIEKVNGLEWKVKIAVGWAKEQDVADAIVIRLTTGEEYRFTAMPLRNELFNRLIAIGGQKWKSL